MEITYTLTADDYRQCLRAYRNRQFFTRWFWRLLYTAIFLCIVVPLLFLVIGRHQEFRQLQPLFIIGVIWAALFLYSPYRMGNRLIKGSPGAREPRTAEITGAGIHSRSALTETTLAWGTFVDAREGPRVFTLFLSPISFIPIPKRAMTEAQQEEFRVLLKQHVKTL